ncbi:MAG: Panthothenate synthetase, partial [Rhodospirillales bacterium]|nr:Panthothenate synthetase [Rhodospirillales bacterium]
MAPSVTDRLADLETVRSVPDLRARVAAWRKDGLSVGLVPTMGALHEGHFSLVRRSVTTQDRTIVTLFVNPRQFGPNEDYGTYPRTEEADAAALERQGAHVLFAPGVDEMYPAGAVTTVSVPGIGDILEGAFRPGFFTGVATVVSKLLIQAAPDVAYFGQKDYQQLCVITRMAADLDLAVKIEGCPIVREPDGLALSSRNVYLSPAERKIAPTLNRVLNEVAAAVRTKGPSAVATAEAAGAQALLTAGFHKVDYVTVRD